MNKEELLQYGLEVFNNENDKFQRWLIKSNITLYGKCPQKLLDSPKGIKEVKNCLDRIEYGNFN